jgi:hypothetical protein
MGTRTKTLWPAEPGNATYNLTNSAAPGVAVMVTRLNGVTR